MEKDRENKTSNRRSFLKRTGSISGGLMALSTIPSSVTAKKKNTGQGTEDVGITKAVQRLTKQQKFEKAKQLLEKHDIEYDHDRVKVAVPSQDDGVSAQEVFNDEKSTFDFFGYETTYPLYNVELHWDLHPRYPESDCPDPRDGNAISFSQDRWAFEPNSENLDTYNTNFSVENEGTYAKWDDAEAYVGDGVTTGHQIVGLEKQESGAHNVYGHYIHTYQNLCGAASVAFSISYKYFGISSSGGGVSSWKMEYPDIPIIEI